MKKIFYIAALFLTSTAFSQVLVTKDNSNTTVHSSVGLEARTDNQAAALPEYFITSLTTYPYSKAPKEGSIVFSSNKGGLKEQFYGYFFWDGTKWVKLLDAQSFSSNYDFSVPYFYTNFDKATQTSTGIELSSPFTTAGQNNTSSTLSAKVESNHVIGATLDTNYWTILDQPLQPTFSFANNATGLVKVNAIMTKLGGGLFDFDVAMGIFLNDKLVANKVYPITNLSGASTCIRQKASLIASIGNLTAGQSYTIKVGFRIVGNNYFSSGTGASGFDNYRLDKSKIVVGKQVTNITSGSAYTACELSAFESPVNITVFGVSNL